MLALSDGHVRGRSQEAYGRSEGERVHQPQLNGEVVGAALRQRRCHQYTHMTSPLLPDWTAPVSEVGLTFILDRNVAN